MPSPESPANRTVAYSRSRISFRAAGVDSSRTDPGGDPGGDPGETEPGVRLAAAMLSRPVTLRRGWRGRRLIVHSGGKMLDEIMDDPLHGQHSDRLILVNNRQVPVAAFFHTANGGPNRIFRIDSDRIRRHTIADERGERFPLGHDSAQQVTPGKNADNLAFQTDQHATDRLLSHQVDRLGHGL